MSLFDDIPLEPGTKYYESEILAFDEDAQKYLVFNKNSKPENRERWISRSTVESLHGNSLMHGVETRQASPGTSYNTRYYRSKTN